MEKVNPIYYDDASPTRRRAIRKRYVIEQGGVCYYCKSHLDEDPPKEILNKKVNKRLFPKSFFNWPVHLHHSHDTGLTLGAVHCYCNAILWQYHGE